MKNSWTKEEKATFRTQHPIKYPIKQLKHNCPKANVKEFADLIFAADCPKYKGLVTIVRRPKGTTTMETVASVPAEQAGEWLSQMHVSANADYYITKAQFSKAQTWDSNTALNSSNSTYSLDSKMHVKDVVEDVVIADASVSAQLTGEYNPASRLSKWVIKNETSDVELGASDITYETKTYPGQPAGGESYQAPTFKVDGKSEYSITAIFEAKDYGAVNVTVNDTKMGEATAQVDGGEASSSLTVVYEGVTVKLKATPKEGFIFKSWKASYGDDTQVTIADENAAETTFKMPATGEMPVNVVAEFAVDPSYLSEDCALTDVTLLDNNDSGIAYYGDQDLTNFTIEVPADTDNAKLAGMILKLTVSENAQVFQDGSDTPWDANGQACNMTLGIECYIGY